MLSVHITKQGLVLVLHLITDWILNECHFMCLLPISECTDYGKSHLMQSGLASVQLPTPAGPSVLILRSNQHSWYGHFLCTECEFSCWSGVNPFRKTYTHFVWTIEATGDPVAAGRRTRNSLTVHSYQLVHRIIISRGSWWPLKCQFWPFIFHIWVSDASVSPFMFGILLFPL